MVLKEDLYIVLHSLELYVKRFARIGREFVKRRKDYEKTWQCNAGQLHIKFI